jgi:hypothetical protein
MILLLYQIFQKFKASRREYLLFQVSVESIMSEIPFYVTTEDMILIISGKYYLKTGLM